MSNCAPVLVVVGVELVELVDVEELLDGKVLFLPAHPARPATRIRAESVRARVVCRVRIVVSPLSG
jgi:hypothetical protein